MPDELTTLIEELGRAKRRESEAWKTMESTKDAYYVSMKLREQAQVRLNVAIDAAVQEARNG